MSHPEFPLRLRTDEVERREVKRLDVRLRRANLEHAKSLEGLDFAFTPR